eukprot:ANDGO_03399.mRNA.1 hypothetical protein
MSSQPTQSVPSHSGGGLDGLHPIWSQCDRRTKTEQSLLQKILVKPLMTLAELLEAIRTSMDLFGQGAFVVDRDGPSILKQCIEILHQYGMDYRMVVLKRDRFFGLTNTLEDEISKLATGFDSAEMEFIKRMFTYLAEMGGKRDKGSIILHCQDLLNDKKRSAVMQKLLEDRWVEQTGDEITFGPRGYLELKPFFETLLENSRTEEGDNGEESQVDEVLAAFLKDVISKQQAPVLQ